MSADFIVQNFLVDVNRNVELAGNLNGAIRRSAVDQHHLIDQRDFVHQAVFSVLMTLPIVASSLRAGKATLIVIPCFSLRASRRADR